MRCPICGSENDKVVDTRPGKEGSTVRRRRQCLQCQHRYTTYEKLALMSLNVIKKDGSKQEFDRHKLLLGLQKSCWKRPVSTEMLEKIADEVEDEAIKISYEINSHQLGEMVLAKLRYVDEVAYIRFASVYREYSDVTSFIAELAALRDLENVEEFTA